MDPNECLAEVRFLIATRNADPAGFSDDDTARLIELVEALDVWMATGGFLPEQWRRT